MTRRYYCSELPTNRTLVSLGEAEAGHAIKVMRVQVGDEVELFDGQGKQAKATVTSLSRKECHLKLESVQAIDREPSIELTFAIALPKPDRCKEMIQRLTELGVHRVVPVVASRTQREPSSSLLQKLRLAVVEACKQSQRNVLMEIADPVQLGIFLAEATEATVKWVAHPDGETIASRDRQTASSAMLLIGPEGGWIDEEVADSVSAGYKKVSLGKRIYRIETAAVYLASKLIQD